MAAVLGICTLALTTTVNAEVVTATQAAVAYQSVETAAIGIQAGFVDQSQVFDFSDMAAYYGSVSQPEGRIVVVGDETLVTMAAPAFVSMSTADTMIGYFIGDQGGILRIPMSGSGGASVTTQQDGSRIPLPIC